LTDLANAIATALGSDQFQRFVGMIQGGMEMAGQAIDGLIAKLAPVGNAVSAAFDAMTKGDFASFAQAIGNAVTEGLNAVLQTIEGFGATIFGAGADLVNQLVGGIASQVGSAFNEA